MIIIKSYYIDGIRYVEYTLNDKIVVEAFRVGG